MTDDVFKDLCPGPSDSVKVTEQYQLVMQRDGLDDAGELIVKLILVQVWRNFCWRVSNNHRYVSMAVRESGV